MILHPRFFSAFTVAVLTAWRTKLTPEFTRKRTSLMTLPERDAEGLSRWLILTRCDFTNLGLFSSSRDRQARRPCGGIAGFYSLHFWASSMAVFAIHHLPAGSKERYLRKNSWWKSQQHISLKSALLRKLFTCRPFLFHGCWWALSFQLGQRVCWAPWAITQRSITFAPAIRASATTGIFWMGLA